MAKMSIAEALRQAIREEMERDPRVFCIGEDIGIEGGFGGAFTVTLGLSEQFGHERILDTPISETGLAGVAPLVLAETPIQGIRAAIAGRMSESASATARVTLTAQVDATRLVTLRERLAEVDLPVSYNDLLLKVVARALREHPALNASLEDRVLRQWKQVNIGLALYTHRGLLVPVVREADAKGWAQLARETADLIGRAQAGTLRPDQLRGGTFTLTNLGVYGVDAFTPIINLLETAILGVGRIKPRPAVRDDQVVIREMVSLSLTFDHRLVDGAPAARFLQRIVELVEQPYLLCT